MHSVILLVLRRIRVPLIALILAYAIAVLGLVLIPGQDDKGQPWQMDFFHAFYFVSFTAATVGFGEIPYAFTDAQRIWVTFSIYLTAVVWIYSIGTLISLLQEPEFRQVLTERGFFRRVRRLHDPFYLICGYGGTGAALVQGLTNHGQKAVVLDNRQERINDLYVEDLRQYVPGLCAEAMETRNLIEAGLQHPSCAGVVAVTDSNDVNLHVAITAKLLRPELMVICRADTQYAQIRMLSFGTDYVVDPYDTFAAHLATAIHSPWMYLLREWMMGLSANELREPLLPPNQGLWVIFGFGRFGRAVHGRLQEEGVETLIVEEDSRAEDLPKGSIVGRGVDVSTLHDAGIDRAVGLVAGTNDDVDNLSIIMKARQLNPRIFVILRQNLKSNDPLAQAVKADIIMHPSAIIAERIRILLGTPLLGEFLNSILEQEDDWARVLINRIVTLVVDEEPRVWEIRINTSRALAVTTAIKEGRSVLLSDLAADPRDRQERLSCLPLMLQRQGTQQLLPEMETKLQTGDRVLFCGVYGAQSRMAWTLQNVHALHYILDGRAAHHGAVWGWLRQYLH